MTRVLYLSETLLAVNFSFPHEKMVNIIMKIAGNEYFIPIQIGSLRELIKFLREMAKNRVIFNN
jgi:hypothetical protein